MDITYNTKEAFKIKTTLLPVLILELATNNIKYICDKLAKNAAQAPKLITEANVIVDLDKLDPAINIDIEKLALELQACFITILGIKDSRNCFTDQISKSKFNLITNFDTATAKPAVKDRVKSKIHTGNLRSGQQIYAKGSDLVIMGSVNHGAEVVADGNIHIYGSLKGKAMAGVRGDTSARIFSLSFYAQLIAIAGIYKVFEAPANNISTTKPAVSHLHNEKIETINI